MKIFIRTNYSDYQETTITELQNKIDSYYVTIYAIDEITEECMYITQISTDE